MSWREWLPPLEERGEWKQALLQFEGEQRVGTQEGELYARILFLLLDFVVDDRYTNAEHVQAAQNLKAYFDQSRGLLSESAEYAFFMGYIIPLSEWYFGVDVAYALALRREATLLEPANLLYQWGYVSIDYDSQGAIQLARQLLLNRQPITWLSGKGLLGRYLIGMVENCANQSAP